MSIAGPNQSDRTLIELYANKMSSDPNGAVELFTESAQFQPTKASPILFKGRPQIADYLAKGPKQTYAVVTHLPRQGDDNFAELRAEGAGAAAQILTVRFRTDGHSITELEVVSTRPA